MFAVDGSRSVDKQMFMKIKDHLNGLLKAYDVSKQKIRIGLVTFGEQQRRDLKVEAGTSEPVVRQTIYDMKRIGGDRKVLDVIKFVDKNMFDGLSSVSAGKLLVLITASSASRRGLEDSHKSALEDLKRKNINLIAVTLNMKKEDEELAVIQKNNILVDLQDADQLKSALTPVLHESGKAAGIFHSNCFLLEYLKI